MRRNIEHRLDILENMHTMRTDSIAGSPEVLLAFCTCPDEETATRIAEALVVERLAACVNRLPALTSVYLLEG